MARFFGDPLIRGRSQRGLSLVPMLWVLMPLPSIAASFTKMTRSGFNLTYNAKAEPGSGLGASLFFSWCGANRSVPELCPPHSFLFGFPRCYSA